MIYIGLSAPSNVEVTALYNLKSELSGIEVKWQEVVSICEISALYTSGQDSNDQN